MPRIAGVNLVGVLAAAVAVFFIGFIWYGLLFSEPWMNANGMFFADEAKTVMQWLTADGLQTLSMDEGPNPMVMLWGFVLSVAISFGLGWFMKRQDVAGLAPATLFGLMMGLLIGVPLMAYDTVYTPYNSLIGLAVDGSHTLATFAAACMVMSFFD